MKTTYNKVGHAEELKTIGAIMIEALGHYDNQASKKLGRYLKTSKYVEGKDFMFIKMPAPDGSGNIIGAKAWRSHTWEELRQEIRNLKELL
ncbi:hypothetical protein [Listeria ilorinensis]|uniref:hypothetical protein n=1 Tax=Listeria ilorinensis TaxID=2867439 RepID=UPI001EF5F22D|nr:hypothetical protein [Listeria ilorinensis]